MRPERHLTLRADHFDLLRTFALQGIDLISTGDLLHRLKGPDGDHATASADLGRLLEHGVFRRAEGLGDDLELPSEVRDDVLWLCDRQRALTPGILKGVIEDMDARLRHLDAMTEARDIEATARALEELRTFAADIANFCATNRRAVVAAVLDLKARQDSRSLRQRFQLVESLHDRFIEPMREIVDDRGPLHDTQRRTLAAARRTAEAFAGDPQIAYEVERLNYRVASLQHQTHTDFLTSSKEVMPLYAQYRKDSLLAEHAAACLERFHREGPGLSDISEAVPIANLRVEGIFAEGDVRSFLQTIARQAVVTRRPLRFLAASGPADNALSDEDVLTRLRAATPVDDLLGWLFREFPDASEDDVLRAFSDLLMGDALKARLFVGGERRLQVGQAVYTHHAIEIDEVIHVA